MGKKTTSRSKQSKKAPKDLSAGPKAAQVKAGATRRSTFIKSWSTSGDAD